MYISRVYSVGEAAAENARDMVSHSVDAAIEGLKHKTLKVIEKVPRKKKTVVIARTNFRYDMSCHQLGVFFFQGLFLVF